MKARQLLSEIGKNFRLMFRNWTTLTLLVLAPLLLILLVGYAFSSDSMHGIKIGMIYSQNESLGPFLQNVSSYAEVINYPDVNSCISDMMQEKVHICLTFRGSFATANLTQIPGGEITFYHDNTRTKITTALVAELKDFFGVTAEQISLVSAQNIFDNIQNLLFFLRERMNDVDAIKSEATDIRADLSERKQKLEEVRESFLPKYYKIKDLQEKINNYSVEFNETYLGFYYEFNQTRKLFASMRPLLSKMNELAQNITVPSMNLTNRTKLPSLNKTLNLTGNISAQANFTPNLSVNVTSPINETGIRERWFNSSRILNSSISLLDLQLTRMLNISNATRQQFFELKAEFDSSIYELDMIKQLLDDEINRTDYYIREIDASLVKINEITADLNTKMQSLVSLDPGLAEKLVKPIAQSFQALLSNVRNIQIAFPLLLAAIAMFISLLFSNIVTLMEVHSRAYLRNIIAPVNDLTYTTGLMLTNFIVVLFQVAILLVIAQTRFSINVTSHLGELLLVVVIFILIFVFIGMLLAYLFTSMQASVLTTTFIALLVYLFSDAVAPLEAMPLIAAKVAALNPVVLFEGIVKKLLLFDLNLYFMQRELLILSIFLVAALCLLILVSKIKNRRRL